MLFPAMPLRLRVRIWVPRLGRAPAGPPAIPPESQAKPPGASSDDPVYARPGHRRAERRQVCCSLMPSCVPAWGPDPAFCTSLATGSLLQHTDGASRPRSIGQTLISGQQLTAQSLGECDVGGVVYGHVRA
jgi:hypothetical protein